eukprot:g3478.t1
MEDDVSKLTEANKSLSAALSNFNVGAAGSSKSPTDGKRKGGDKGKSGKSPSSGAKRPMDLIARLQEQGDMFTRKIELEKRTIDDLKHKLEVLHQKTLSQKQRMGGANAAQETQATVNKRLHVLDNRLDNAMVKYNEALANNKSLREKINAARRQRMVYDNIYTKLEAELSEKKREMAKIIAESNVAYENRDKLQKQMQELKVLVEKEQKSFEEAWARLGKEISDDSDLHETALKAKERAVKEAEEADEAARKAGSDDLNRQEAQLKKKAARGAWSIAKDKASLQLSQERIQSYEDAFAKIQAATGIDDIDELVDKFIEAEEKNFSVFNYVNILNQDIEKLDVQISEAKGEIEKYRGQGADTDSQRKKILRDLEQKLQRTNSRILDYNARYDESAQVLNDVKEKVKMVFERIGCGSPEHMSVVGEGGISDSNLMQYLGIIEQRTNEILQMYAASAESAGALSKAAAGKMGADAAEAAEAALAASKPGAQLGGSGPSVPTGTLEVRIDPPKLDDSKGSDKLSGVNFDQEDRPLTRVELMRMVSEGVRQKAIVEAKIRDSRAAAAHRRR